MKETLESIIAWHKETFPLACEHSQQIRFHDEHIEFIEADCDEKKLEELADMHIAACGLARFNTSPVYFTYTAMQYDKFNTQSNHFEGLRNAINKKMAINRKRAEEDYWTYCEVERQYIAKHKIDYKEFDTVEDLFEDLLDNKE